MMVLTVDFNSGDALYMQLCNQIIYGIATEMLREGESLPSVRQLAEEVGINMHTVNKAYAVLRQGGYLRLDRRHGAIIAVDTDKKRALNEMRQSLRNAIARGICKDVRRNEVHALIDQIFDEIEGREAQ